MTGDNVELSLMQRAGSDMPPYQRLLGDAMRGNNELFGREDTIDAQWRIVEPILKNPPAVQEYAPGTWGPEAANALIGADGPWRNPAAPAKACKRSPRAVRSSRAASRETTYTARCNGPGCFPFRPSSTSRARLPRRMISASSGRFSSCRV